MDRSPSLKLVKRREGPEKIIQLKFFLEKRN